MTDLQAIVNDPELLEVGRKAVEEVLIEWRDARISVMRNNGLVIREADGENSDVIRMGPEDAIKIGLQAIVKHLAIQAEEGK